MLVSNIRVILEIQCWICWTIFLKPNIGIDITQTSYLYIAHISPREKIVTWEAGANGDTQFKELFWNFCDN